MPENFLRQNVRRDNANRETNHFTAKPQRQRAEKGVFQANTVHILRCEGIPNRFEIAHGKLTSDVHECHCNRGRIDVYPKYQINFFHSSTISIISHHELFLSIYIAPKHASIAVAMYLYPFF